MMDDYKNKVKELLNNIFIKKEVPQVKSEEIDVIKQNGGYEATIKKIFNENYEVPHFISSEPEEHTYGGKYKTVLIPSSFKDIDDYWFSILPKLKQIGEVVSEKDGHLTIKKDDKSIHIILCRDVENDKPGLIIKTNDFNIPDIVELIVKTGLKVDRLSVENLVKSEFKMEVYL